MLIGFTITATNGHDADAIAFIQKVCMLADPIIAANLVARTPKANVYPNDPSLIDEALLAAQPFTAIPIYTTVDITAISIVDFPLEMPYISDLTGKMQSVKLKPTEYANIDYAMYKQFKWFVDNQYIRTVPVIPTAAIADYTAQDFSSSDFFAE